MRSIALLAAAVVFMPWTEDPRSTENRDAAERIELDKVTGVWVQAGANVPPENAKARLIYRGREFEGRLGDKVLFKGSVRLDPTKNPKALDLTLGSGPNQAKTLLGVYELDDENYRGCLAAPDKPRPTSLIPAPHSGQQSFAFRRVRETEPSTSAIQAELKRFEGTWSYASVVADGKHATDETLKASRLVLAADQFTLIAPGACHKGTFSLNPTATPKSVDVTFSEGPRAGKTIKGIYELNADTCRVCRALADGPRPTEFASPAGRGHALEVLKRVKP